MERRGCNWWQLVANQIGTEPAQILILTGSVSSRQIPGSTSPRPRLSTLPRRPHLANAKDATRVFSRDTRSWCQRTTAGVYESGFTRERCLVRSRCAGALGERRRAGCRNADLRPVGCHLSQCLVC
jgi:hypothetical protein